MNVKQLLWSAGVLSVGICLLTRAGLAQDESPGPAGPVPAASLQILPTARGTLTVTERTPEHIAHFEATHAPLQPRPTPFRPTMSEAAYRIRKTTAESQPLTPKPDVQTAAPLHGITGATGFPGANQADNASVSQPFWFPPDTQGAIGVTQFVEVVNNMLNVYSRTGVLLKRLSLNALMGFTTTPMFDPRVAWDALWGRWIVTADSFPVLLKDPPASPQYFWLAVSQTTSATGAWWVYSTDTIAFTGDGSFWDFPSVGLDQDGIIITANVFNTRCSNGFCGAYTFPLAKAQVYNGFPQEFPVWGGLWATLQPPMVQKRDLNGYAWLAAAPPGAGAIYMYALRDTSRPNAAQLFGPYPVSGVQAYEVPPSAPQTCGGGPNALDTSDNRFVSASTQNGDLLYQVHTVALKAFAAPRYYVIKGLQSFAPAVAESGEFWASASSYDFNASIAADAHGDLVMTWTATDPMQGHNAAVRYVGKQAGEPAINGAIGNTLLTSTACLMGNYDAHFGHQRWGDYSAVSVDPLAAHTFWLINEDIASISYWGSAIGQVHFSNSH